MSEKKNYVTFMSVVNANKKDGGTFHFAVMRGSVGRFQKRTVHKETENEKDIISASMPISGRQKLINGLFDTNYADGETIWADLTFWNCAERLGKFLEKSNDPERVQMIVTGAMSLNKYTKNDGSEGKNVRIMVNDFNVVSTSNNDSSASAPSQAAASSNTTSANGGFDDDGYFEMDEDGIDDDLPF